MRPIVATALLVTGVTFIFVAGLGVARLPDVFQRMHAATKAGGIGTSLILLGVIVAGGVSLLTAKLTIVFMLLTLSVASQLLGRAAYLSGAALRGLDRDDPLAAVLDRADVALDGGADPSPPSGSVSRAHSTRAAPRARGARRSVDR